MHRTGQLKKEKETHNSEENFVAAVACIGKCGCDSHRMQLWQPQATQLWQLESSFAVLGLSLKHLLQIREHIRLTLLRGRPLRRRRVLNRPLSSPPASS